MPTADKPDLFANGMTYTVGVVDTSAQLSANDLLASMEMALASMPPEPWAEFMRKKGYPPQQGWVLILPEGCREAAGALHPSYVRFSDRLQEPVFVQDLKRGLDEFYRRHRGQRRTLR